MARIYYTEEKLSGEPLKSDVINIELFDFIFQSTDARFFEIQSERVSLFSRLIKTEPRAFRNIQLTRDGFCYEASGTSYFLPRSIIFYDVADYNFPTEFYFIANIGDSLELRRCNGGKGIEWHQFPELHKPVADVKVLRRIEKSMLKLKALAEENLNARMYRESKQKEPKETSGNEGEKLALSRNQQKGYQELMALCVQNDSWKEKIADFLANLKEDDEEIALIDLICFLEEREYHFIMRMDWAAEVSDLEWLLCRNIESNHGLKIDLPNPENYGEDATVSFDHVFKDYDTALRENGLQMGFVDTESDEYIALLHRVQDKERVAQAVNNIGFHYDEI